MADKRFGIGDIITAIGELATGIAGSVTFDYCLGETAYEFGFGRTETTNTSSDTAGKVGPVSTENPIGTTGVGVIALSVSATSEGEPDGILIIFHRDCVPYTRVEKNAVCIYNAVHKEKLNLSKPVIIGRTYDSYEGIRKLFGKNGEISFDSICAIERVLESISDESKSDS